MKTVLPALAAAAFTLAACESDLGTPSSGVSDTTDASDSRPSDTSAATRDTTPAPADVTPPTPDTGGIDPIPDPCDREGWAPEGLVGAQSTGENDQLEFGFLESYLTNPTSETDPLTVLYLELYYVLGAETGPFTFDVTGENDQDCAVCGLIYTNCEADGACESAWLVQSGTLEITANGGKDGQLTGVLRGARFAEVTINEDYESTLVDGGQTWCVDRYAFDAALTYVPAASE